MQPVEDFLREYFRSRTESYRVYYAAVEPLVKTFFATGYEPFNVQKSVSQSEAETILESTSRSEGPEVTTSGPFGGRWRARYRLIALSDSWRITSVEMECGICHGSGRSKNKQEDCRVCKGKGWQMFGNNGA